MGEIHIDFRRHYVLMTQITRQDTPSHGSCNILEFF